MKKLSNLQLNFFWNSFGSLAYQGCLWFMTVLVASLSTNMADAGLLRLSMSVSNIFFTVAIYGIRAFQVSDMTGKYKDKTYILSRFFTCAVSILACFVIVLWRRYDMLTSFCIMSYMLFRISEAIMDVLHGITQRADRLYLAGQSFTIRGIVSIVAFCIGLISTKNIAITILIMAISSFLVVLVFDVPKTKSFTDFTEKTDIKQSALLLKECLPLACYAFLNTAIANIPVVYLEEICGSEQLGIYSTVSAPAVVIQMGATYLFTPFITSFAKTFTEKQKKAFYSLILKMCVGILAFGMCGIVGGEILGEWGLGFLYPTKPQVWARVDLLVPIIICTIFTAFVLFFNMILTIIRDFKGLVISNLLGIIVCFIACPLLINAFELSGANYALMLSLGTQLLFLVIFGYFKARKHFKV